MTFIPEEVWGEILLRLPAESLIICKRVCKSWLNLIKDLSFVNKHLLRITHEHRKISSSYSRTFVLKWIRQELSLEDIFDGRRIFYENDISKHELSLVTVNDNVTDADDDNLSCVIQQVSLPPFPVKLPYFPNNLIAFHCNGIIHMFDKSKSKAKQAILLNPILREFKLLRTPDPPFKYSVVDSYKFVGSGFGYDPKANVYKYVTIFGILFRDPIALVYTMGSPSSWRMIKIDVDVEGNPCFLYSKGVYCKGTYYWMNAVSDTDQTILSFDMSEEKFRTIPIPDHLIQRMLRKFKRLEVWKESICIFFDLEASWISSIFEIWVMDDNCGGVEGGSTTWTKLLTIGPLALIHFPLAFWKDDELLMETKDGRIVSYNICTQKLRKVPLPGAVLPGSSYAYLCLNSLVSV